MPSDGALNEWLTWAFSPTWSAILVTIIVALSLPVIQHLYLYRKASSKELPSFLLLGPSGGGKTSLLTLFANQQPSPTHTSQAPVTALCQLPSSTRSREDRFRSENDTSSRSQPKFHLIDTPGHGKLRNHATTSLNESKSLRGLIYVVDSAAISSAQGLAEAAEYLHDILLVLQKRHTQGKTSKGPQALPVLIAANKQDVFTSLPTAMVRRRLEDEITKVRQARSKGLLDSGIGMEDGAGGDDERNWLGEYGSRVFGFAQMEEHGVDVKVSGGNVLGDRHEAGQVDEWWSWVGDSL